MLTRRVDHIRLDVRKGNVGWRSNAGGRTPTEGYFYCGLLVPVDVVPS